jgi:hypothetical protein
LNPGSCIFYALSLPTEPSSRGQTQSVLFSSLSCRIQTVVGYQSTSSGLKQPFVSYTNITLLCPTPNKFLKCFWQVCLLKYRSLLKQVCLLLYQFKYVFKVVSQKFILINKKILNRYHAFLLFTHSFTFSLI